MKLGQYPEGNISAPGSGPSWVVLEDMWFGFRVLSLSSGPSTEEGFAVFVIESLGCPSEGAQC